MSAFRVPLLSDAWPPGTYGFLPCPVCGEKWRPWAGSYLPCHARCLLTPEAQHEMLMSTASITSMAETLGVTVAVVRASIAEARKRRDARRAERVTSLPLDESPITQLPVKAGAPCAICVDRVADRMTMFDGRFVAACGACCDEHPRSGRWTFDDASPDPARPLPGTCHSTS